jgi:hypothetical protein
MSARRRDVLIGAAALATTPALARAQAPTMGELARRATIFLFPLHEMWRTRWNAIGNPANPRRGTENVFGHARMLSDHRARAVTTPNNDTLYSSAWLDLSQGPLLLTVPDTAGRYYSLAFMDAWTNNFAYVGRRTTGTKAGRYFVAGPDWRGDVPDGHAPIRAPTNLVWLLGRTLVDGADDLAAAGAIMRGYTLSPSAEPRAPSRLVAQDTAVPTDAGDAAGFFEIVRRARLGNPPAAHDRPELDALAPLAAFWEAGGEAPATTDARWPAVAEGYAEARRLLRTARMLGGGTVRGGWTVPPPALGNYGTQYALRAAVALTGLAALEPAEATYLSADVDSDGQPLSGAHRYSERSCQLSPGWRRAATR